MIEIVFSDSACGSLKTAQHFGEGNYQSGFVGIIISHEDGSKPTQKEIIEAKREAEEKRRLAWKNAEPLGGNSADVYGFHIVQSIGDISENPPGVKREKFLKRLYSIYANDTENDFVQEILKTGNANLKKVRERVEMGEPVRIWYSNQPDEMCGLYWLMWHINQWTVHDDSVFIVKLPEWGIDENQDIVKKNGWGEVAPEEWRQYLAMQKSVSQVFIQGYASQWETLQRENAPLRVVLNGQLVSVSENIYDAFILREIAEAGEEFQEAMIIGKVLGKYRLGISDAWLALRIEEMIGAGAFEVVSLGDHDMPVYHRMLRKSNHS